MKQSSIITSLTSKIQTGFRYKRILSFHRGYTIKSKNCTNLSIIIQSRILKSRLIFQYLGKLSIVVIVIILKSYLVAEFLFRAEWKQKLCEFTYYLAMNPNFPISYLKFSKSLFFFSRSETLCSSIIARAHLLLRFRKRN